MMIRHLVPQSDRALVDAFFCAAADYIRLERDEDPSPLVTEEFFSVAPPSCDPTASLRLGLFDPHLLAIAEMAFGYPTATDAYLTADRRAHRPRQWSRHASIAPYRT